MMVKRLPTRTRGLYWQTWHMCNDVHQHVSTCIYTREGSLWEEGVRT